MILDRGASCITRWLPAVEASGVPYPETRIIRAPSNLLSWCDGKEPEGWEWFLAALRAAGDAFGYPCFLRTGQTSGKHSWNRTCFIQSADDFPQHVGALVEFSEMADMLGLPYDVWVLRRFLALESTFTAFEGFPVNRERRYFIRDGEVVCHHCYWPPGAVAEGNPTAADWRARLADLNRETPEEVELLLTLSAQVAKHLPGSWSVDWAKGKDGVWYCIDAAVASESFHWPDCPMRSHF